MYACLCVYVHVPHIIIYGVIIYLPQLIDVEVQLDLAQNTLHHGHQNVLVPTGQVEDTCIPHVMVGRD